MSRLTYIDLPDSATPAYQADPRRPIRPVPEGARYHRSRMDGTEIRMARPDDVDEILDCCSVSLGWDNPDFDRALFRWKHEANPFGRSLIMVAETSSGIVAARPFMRWRFRRGSATLNAARAVDTATRPEARGKGLFRTLTMSGLEVLRNEGLDLIFNTPNDQSRPGYLRMDWQEVGRVPFGFRPRSLGSLSRLPGARVAASKSSLPESYGIEVCEGLATSERTLGTSGDLLTSASANTWTTDYDVEALSWRFDQGPVRYRFIPGPAGSGTITRTRRRGTAVELLIAATVGKADDSARKAAMRLAFQRTKADYCLAPASFPNTITTSRIGPSLTMRTVSTEPTPEQHTWQPGDIELF